MLKKLILLANRLDNLGLEKEAKLIDSILYRLAATDVHQTAGAVMEMADGLESVWQTMHQHLSEMMKLFPKYLATDKKKKGPAEPGNVFAKMFVEKTQPFLREMQTLIPTAISMIKAVVQQKSREAKPQTASTIRKALKPLPFVSAPQSSPAGTPIKAMLEQVVGLMDDLHGTLKELWPEYDGRSQIGSKEISAVHTIMQKMTAYREFVNKLAQRSASEQH